MLTDAALRNLKPKSKIYKASDRDGMYVTVSPSGTVTALRLPPQRPPRDAASRALRPGRHLTGDGARTAPGRAESRAQGYLARARKAARETPGGRHQDLRHGDGHLAGQRKVGHADMATTLDPARACAGRLKAALESRTVHEEVLSYCRAELLDENYFHAVFEATKGVAERIRTLSGLSGDGADLVNKAFAGQQPVLVLGPLITESEKSEQKGFANLSDRPVRGRAQSIGPCTQDQLAHVRARCTRHSDRGVVDSSQAGSHTEGYSIIVVRKSRLWVFHISNYLCGKNRS